MPGKISLFVCFDKDSGIIVLTFAFVENDATFLMDHSEKNQTYTTLKLFSHRSWKLSSSVDPRAAPLFFDVNEKEMLPSGTSELLVVAQPCPVNKIVKQQGRVCFLCDLECVPTRR